MRILLITILLFVCFAARTLGQSIPGMPVSSGAGSRLVQQKDSLLSGYKKKVSASKDTVISGVQRFVKPGKALYAARQDTIRPRVLQGGSLARPAEMNDPVQLFPSLDRSACKNVLFLPEPPAMINVPVARKPRVLPPPPAPVAKAPFLQVHGNVLYNLNYYSRIDTPYNEREVYQHTIQTWLDVLVKGQYPFRIYLTNHFSNTPWFRNYSDYNLGYNNAQFGQQIRDQVRREYMNSLPSPKVLDSLRALMNKDWNLLQGINGWIKNPALIQKMIEARERAMLQQKMPGIAIADADPEAASIDSLLSVKKHMADSLRQDIAGLQQALDAAHQRSQAEIDRNLQDIQRSANPKQLRSTMKELGLADSALPKGYSTLMAVKSLNLGRTVLNYSELSVKNISINGVQVEYNPSDYFAFASGGVNYRFRDYLLQSPGSSGQYLNVFRYGKALRGDNSIILTYFTGKRQLYNAATTDSPAVAVPSSRLMGFTLEGNYHLTRNILLTGEVGKSSLPAYAGDASKGRRLTSQLFQLNEHSNEAWSLKLNALFPRTDTRVKATYKKLGVNYQSFSIFTDGSARSSWSANVGQLFFRRQLDVQVGASTNDFTNPFIGQQYRSTTVFKSFQATLRKRRWPVISLGYFPSSQITKLGKDQYLENYFYTMVGNVTHSYAIHQVLMNTALVYTQFYNRSSDSGFAWFNTRNLMLSQSFFLGRLTLQGNAAGAWNQEYQLYTLEARAQHALSQILTIGAGIKYNKQTKYDIEQFGYSAEATLRLRRFGQIQFSADKGFIPGMNKQLVPDNTGRLTYYKTF